MAALLIKEWLNKQMNQLSQMWDLKITKIKFYSAEKTKWRGGKEANRGVAGGGGRPAVEIDSL